jgi:hypothetical protein
MECVQTRGQHCNLEMEHESHSSSTRAAGLRSDLALNLERAHTTDSWIGGTLNVRLFGSPGYFRAATCPPRRESVSAKPKSFVLFSANRTLFWFICRRACALSVCYGHALHDLS